MSPVPEPGDKGRAASGLSSPVFGANSAILLFNAGLIALIWYVILGLIAADREKTIQSAIDRSNNLAFVFEQYSIRTIENADVVTKSLAREYLRSGKKLDLGRFAATNTTDNKSVVGVVLADEHGNALTTAYTGTLAKGTIVADREHFIVHVKKDSGQLFIGKPVVDRASGKSVIPLTRRVNNVDGSFAGVAMALIEPDRFTDVLRDAKLRPLDVVSLVGLDGVTRARLSGNTASWGEDISASPLFAEQAKRPSGNYFARGQRDDVLRHYSYRTLPGYQAMATVGAAESDVLADFRERRLNYILGAGVVSLVIAGFCITLVVSLQRRKRVERERHESDLRFRTIFEQAGMGIAMVAVADGRILNCNGALARMLGYSVDELCQLTVEDVSDPADYVTDEQQWRAMADGQGEHFHMEKRYRRKDGSPMWGVLTSTMVRSEDPARQFIIGMLEDVSDIKKSRDEVRRLADRLVLTMENINDAFIALDREWRFTYLNKAAEQLLRGKREDLLGKVLWEEFTQAVGTVFDRKYRMAMQTMRMAEFEAFYAPLEVWVEVRAYPSKEGLALYFRDVTPRKQAEVASARMNAIVESSNDAIVSKDLDGVITGWNAGAERIFGYARSEVIGRSIAVLVPPDRPGEGQEMLARIARGERVEHFETVRIGKNGRRIDVSITVSPLRDATGQIIGATKVVRDITAKKRAEEALRDYSERMQLLSRRLMQAEEDERRRLGRELHDRTGSNLSALLMSQELLRRKMASAATPEVGMLLDDSEALLRETMQHVRDVLAELRPPALDELGLVAALRHHGQVLARQSGIPIQVEGAEVSPRMPAGVEISLFRIAQEALNNAIKHAQAGRIIISLQRKDGYLELAIDDDGKGFDSAVRHADGSLGMLTMRERAEAIGARFVLRSSAQAGTQVLIVLDWGGTS